MAGFNRFQTPNLAQKYFTFGNNDQREKDDMGLGIDINDPMSLMSFILKNSKGRPSTPKETVNPEVDVTIPSQFTKNTNEPYFVPGSADEYEMIRSGGKNSQSPLPMVTDEELPSLSNNPKEESFFSKVGNWLNDYLLPDWIPGAPNKLSEIFNGNMINKQGKDVSISNAEQNNIFSQGISDNKKNTENNILLEQPYNGIAHNAIAQNPQEEQMYDIQKGDTISELLWKNRAKGTNISKLYNFINQQKDWNQYGIGNDPNKIYAGKQMNLQKLLRDFETYINR